MKSRSLALQLTAWFAALVIALMGAFGGYTYLRVKAYVVEVLQNSLEHRGRQITQILLNDVSNAGESYLANEIEGRYAPERNDRFIRITRDDGTIVYRSGEPNDRSFDPTEISSANTGLHSPRSRRQKLSHGSEILIAALPCYSAGHRYLVEVGASLALSYRVLPALLWTLAAGLVVVLAVMLVGSWALVKRALAPVRGMMLAAENITVHRLNERLPVPNSGDEIAELSIGLNKMIARLDESLQNASRFSADASHELRTPLTIMRGELEEIVTRPGLAPDVRETLGSMLEETERISRIVEQLFALTRLETGEAQVERKRFDLANLVTTTLDQMCLLADEKRICLRCETSDLAPVEGDPARLKQVIVNLVDNAIKYTPVGGNVDLAVHGKNGTVFLEVADDGPGIPPAALPHVFERFYRADAVHSRDIDGAGLGLSIVHSICSVHGGSVAVANRPGGGCKVTVALPRVH
jgi:heavy metal sensor kinase